MTYGLSKRRLTPPGVNLDRFLALRFPSARVQLPTPQLHTDGFLRPFQKLRSDCNREGDSRSYSYL